MKTNVSPARGFFESASIKVTKATGSTYTFIVALLVAAAWVICGPVFNYSSFYATLIINSTTIITFLMVFLIQKSQNKDSLAIQLKLNELVAAHDVASNRLIDVENMTEDELKVIRKYYTKLSDFARKEENLQQSHSIDENHKEHDLKIEMEKELKEKGTKDSQADD